MTSSLENEMLADADILDYFVSNKDWSEMIKLIFDVNIIFKKLNNI